MKKIVGLFFVVLALSISGKDLKYKVEGMVCQACASSIKSAYQETVSAQHKYKIKEINPEEKFMIIEKETEGIDNKEVEKWLRIVLRKAGSRYKLGALISQEATP